MLTLVSTLRPQFFDWFLPTSVLTSRLDFRCVLSSISKNLLPSRDPIHSDIPELHGAELASVYYGRRMAGDFYDFIRVSPNRVLFGLLDVAGGLEDTRAIVSAASTPSEPSELSCSRARTSMKPTR